MIYTITDLFVLRKTTSFLEKICIRYVIWLILILFEIQKPIVLNSSQIYVFCLDLWKTIRPILRMPVWRFVHFSVFLPAFLSLCSFFCFLRSFSSKLLIEMFSFLGMKLGSFLTSKLKVHIIRKKSYFGVFSGQKETEWIQNEIFSSFIEN